MTGAIINRKELMQLLGYKDKDSFRKRLRTLLQFEQFPPCLPNLPNKWSYNQVMAWIAGIRPQTTNISQSGQQATKTPISSLEARLMARKLQIIDGGKIYNS